MKLRAGYAPKKCRPKRIAEKIAKRFGWMGCRVPVAVSFCGHSRRLGEAAAETMNRAVLFSEALMPKSEHGDAE